MHIGITSIGPALDLWFDLLGLEVMHLDTEVASLGDGTRELIVLRIDADAPAAPGTRASTTSRFISIRAGSSRGQLRVYLSAATRIPDRPSRD